MIALVWGREARALVEEREEFRAEARAMDREVTRLLGEISDLREQNLALVRSIVELRREGFDPYRPVGLETEVTPEPDLPVGITQAIERRSEEGSPLRRELIRDAWKMLNEEKMEEHEVVMAILRGGAPEGMSFSDE